MKDGSSRYVAWTAAYVWDLIPKGQIQLHSIHNNKKKTAGRRRFEFRASDSLEIAV